MKDPTRLAAIKALRPTRALWEESCSDIIVTGRGVIAQIPSPRGGGVVERADNRKLILFSADPDYGLQALAAEVERLAKESEKLRTLCAVALDISDRDYVAWSDWKDGAIAALKEEPNAKN